MPIGGPKSIFSLSAGLRASGKCSTSTIVPARMSTLAKSSKLIRVCASISVLVGNGVRHALPCVSNSTLASASLAGVPDQETNWNA